MSLAVMAFGIAAAMLAVGVTHLLLPRAQIHFARGVTPEFFRSLAQRGSLFRFHYWAMVVAALLGAGIVGGARDLLPAGGGPLYRFIEAAALAGFLLTAVDFARMQARAGDLARRFDALSPAAREAVVAQGIGRIDATGLFGFGLVGLWFGAFNYLALGAGVLSRAHAGLGIAGALLYVAVFLGTVLRAALLVDLAVGIGGGLVAPAWFIWLGFVLLSR